VVMDLSWASVHSDRFASAGSDKKVLLWRVGQFAPLCWFDGHTNVVESLKFLNGDFLVTYGRDPFFLVWNTRDVKVVTDPKKNIVDKRVRSD
jgi:WD40 repeat protein